MWIARDKINKDIWLFSSKPIRDESLGCFWGKAGEGEEYIQVLEEDNITKQCTWENSPIEVEFKLKNE